MKQNEIVRRNKISKTMKGRKVSSEIGEKISKSLLKRKKELGYINSPETRKNMSEAKKKNPTNYWLDKKRSEDDKEKIRKAHLGKENSKETRRKISKSNSGNKSHFWKGGITKENAIIRSSAKFKFWREAVFKRDNYTCQKTGIKGGYLISHHIKNFAEYPELRFNIDNGITFSEKAHKEFHKKYGMRHNNEKQLAEFLIK